MSVKGVCENKCLKNVYTTEEINALINSRAEKNHQSSTGENGLGTGGRYGHVKLTTSTDRPTGSMDGIALAGQMGFILNDKIENQRIPVNGSFITPITYTPETMAALLGYGTWGRIGSINLSNGIEYTSVNCWVRLA